MSGGEAVDAVQYAQQLGRLDLISAMLAVLGILLAVLALPVFLYLQHRSAEVAKKEVGKISAELVERIERETNEYVQEELPKIVAEHLAIYEGMVADGVANAIANAQNDGGSENEPVSDDEESAGSRSGERGGSG